MFAPFPPQPLLVRLRLLVGLRTPRDEKTKSHEEPPYDRRKTSVSFFAPSAAANPCPAIAATIRATPSGP